jgi:hypothetical protein
MTLAFSAGIVGTRPPRRRADQLADYRGLLMRLHRWSVVFSLLFLCGPSSASAQGWGREWLERLSGPGPFEGIGLQFPVGCRWNTPGDQKFFWSFQTPIAMTPDSGDKRSTQGQLRGKESTRLLCIDSQYSSATNKDSENVGLIDLRIIEGRVGFPLERGLPWWAAAFEPSIAAGAIRFQGDAFGEWRMTLSPEITVKPLKFIPEIQGKVQNPNKRGDWRGLIEIAYGAILISPKINNEDLHVTFLPPFEHGWLQRSVWVRVNASELVGLR